MPALIEIHQLTYVPPTRRPMGSAGSSTPIILNNISLSIQEGEYVALIGANGSGKTTLARHLNALLLPAKGSVSIAGMDTRYQPNHPAIRALVGMVFQQPEDQVVAGTVEEDIAFGLENLGLPAAEIRRRVEAALGEMGLWNERKRPPHLLSAGQLQRLALAGVLAAQPRCIIFDESTSMLDPLARRELRAQLERLHQAGITLLVITHDMEEAARARRVIVLHQGQIVLDGAPREVFHWTSDLASFGLELPPAASLADQIQPYLPPFRTPILTDSELFANLPPYLGPTRHFPGASHPAVSSQAPLVEISGLEYTYLANTPFSRLALRGVSLSVERASCCGLAGGTGSGKSTLLQHLNGLNRPQSGSVRVGPYHLEDPSVSIRSVAQMVGMAFQVPDYQLFAHYVGDEIAYGPRQVGKTEQLAEQVRNAMQRVGLDFDLYKDRITFSLSGGEKRRVALASALVMQPVLLALDEPLAGLDPGSRKDMLGRFKSWMTEGMTLVFSSHHMEDHAELANHILVLKGGFDFLSGTPVELFDRADQLEIAGLEAPLAARSAARLRMLGWNLPLGICTPAALQDGLMRIKEVSR